MSKKVFIGGLPFAISVDQLKDIFSKAGTIESATIITDRMTGKSKGFGFVEYTTEEEAQSAISMFDGTDIEGRNVKVSEARPMEDRPRRDSRPRGGFRDR